MEPDRVKTTKILFLCTHNDSRSQMAEAFFNACHSERGTAVSAGIEPTRVDQDTVTVMAEKDINLARSQSRSLDGCPHQSLDYVITLCEPDWNTIPALPADADLVRRGFPDPVAKTRGWENKAKILECYRSIRDRIEDFIERLPTILDNETICR